MEYQGQLLIANPIVDEPVHHKKVYLVLDHDSNGTTALCINKPLINGTKFGFVMSNIGLSSLYDQMPLYFGGTAVNNRVFIIHSTDWSGLTTRYLTDDIAITSDVSILTALSEDCGPNVFKPCIGYTRWGAGQIELELASSQSPWSMVESSVELCFPDNDTTDVWKSCIAEVAKLHVNQWF